MKINIASLAVNKHVQTSYQKPFLGFEMPVNRPPLIGFAVVEFQ